MRTLEEIEDLTMSSATNYTITGKSMVWLDSTHVAIAVFSTYLDSGTYYSKSYVRIYTITTGTSFSITQTSENLFYNTSGTLGTPKLIAVSSGGLVLVYFKDDGTNFHSYITTFSYNPSTWAITHHIDHNFLVNNGTNNLTVDSFNAGGGEYVLMIAYCYQGSSTGGHVLTYLTDIATAVSYVDKYTYSTEHNYSQHILHMTGYKFILSFVTFHSSEYVVNAQVFTCGSDGSSITAPLPATQMSVSPLTDDIAPYGTNLVTTTGDYAYLMSAVMEKSADHVIIGKTLSVNSSTSAITFAGNTVIVTDGTNPELTKISSTEFAVASAEMDGHNGVTLIAVSGTTITGGFEYQTSVNSSSHPAEDLVFLTSSFLVYVHSTQIEILGPIALKIYVDGVWRRAISTSIYVDGAWEDLNNMNVYVDGAWEQALIK